MNNENNRNIRIIWSQIRTELTQNFNEQHIKQFISVPEIKNRLSKFLSYYTERIQGSDDDTVFNKHFYNNKEINNELKELIMMISNTLNMSKKSAFDLLDNFFYTNPDTFNTISLLINLFNNFQEKNSNQYYNIILDLENYKNQIIEFYFSERKNLILFLLDIFSKIYNSIRNTPIDLRNYLEIFINEKNLLSIFTNQLIDYRLPNIFDFSRLNNTRIKTLLNNVPIYICEEQKYILDLIMFLINEEQYNKPDILKNLFDYFLGTQFYCCSQNLGNESILLKDEIMIKCLFISLSSFEPNKIQNEINTKQKELLNNLNLFQNNNISSIMNIYNYSIPFLIPIKMMVNCIIDLYKKEKPQGYEQKIQKHAELQYRTEVNDVDCFRFLELILAKIPQNESGDLTIYDVYSLILYKCFNIIMHIYYNDNMDIYPPEVNIVLYKILSKFLPQRKFYQEFLEQQNLSPINKYFNKLKIDQSKRNIFLNMCFALSRPLEPGENSENNEYLLHLLCIEPIENLREKIDQEGIGDPRTVTSIIEQQDNKIFFNNIYEEWNKLINLVDQYFFYVNVQQMQFQSEENLPEDLKHQINYIRLFIRSILPNKAFNDFIYSYNFYYKLKKEYLPNKIYGYNNLDNLSNFDNGDYQIIDSEIYMKFIILATNLLSKITEIHYPVKLFTELINDLFKFFIILSSSDNELFFQSLKIADIFFDKFRGKNIIFNIIFDDNTCNNFSNTLYAVKFLKQMFSPNIFLILARNDEFNSHNNQGASFYQTNFYYIKELINYFAQKNELLTPLEALVITELNYTLIQILNYLEFKNTNSKIEIIDSKNNFDVENDNNNLANFIIKLLLQENKDYYSRDSGMDENNLHSLINMEYFFKFLKIKINDKNILNSMNNSDYNPNKYIYFNNIYVQEYLNSIPDNENYNKYENNYNISCYEKMILSSLHCLNQMFSLLILCKENKSYNFYNKINLISKLKYSFVDTKDLPHYIYESFDDKKQYDLNIIVLMLLYSLYEHNKNRRLVKDWKLYQLNQIDQNLLPPILEYFTKDIPMDKYSNISTMALNNLSQIIYLIRDNNINILNYLTLQKISSIDSDQNINIFKFIRKNITDIFKASNEEYDILKIEILKLFIMSNRYQKSFIKEILLSDDDMNHNSQLIINLSESIISKNSVILRQNIQVNYDLNISKNSLENNYKSELFTYIILFIGELLNSTQDVHILESLLIKESGMNLIKNLIKFGVNSCSIEEESNDIKKTVDKFNEENVNINNINEKEILKFGRNFQLSINDLSLKLNIFKSLCLLFKKILLFSKDSKNNKIDFKFNDELKYFIQIHISKILAIFSENANLDLTNTDLDKIQEKNVNPEIQLKKKYYTDDDILNKDNLEMIIDNYLYRYDNNYSFDLKEYLVKGYFNQIFKEEFLFKIVINNFYTCFNYLVIQGLNQAAHLYGLIFSIGEYNYLLTNNLFINDEIYQIFNEAKNDNKLTNAYNNEISSLLNYDSCYNYKLTFNPISNLFKNNSETAVQFVKTSIIDTCLNNIQNIPNYCFNEHKLYYEFLNISLDYIIYLNSRNLNNNKINSKIELFGLLKKINGIANNCIQNNLINDNNLLSLFNLIFHILYYLIITENSFSDERNNINMNLININDQNNIDQKIQIVLDISETLIIIFKNNKDCRSIILYIFSCIVFIKNDLLKKPINELFSLIMKLYNRYHDSFEFQSFLMLLNRLRINYSTLLMDILKDNRIFHFISIKCGYNSDISLYENGSHSAGHEIYCWTLFTLTNILHTYLSIIDDNQKNNYNVVITNCMKFIEIVQQRFIALFNICLNNNNFISGSDNNSLVTLAYLEELKATVEFITVFVDLECDNVTPSTKDQTFLEFLFDSVDLLNNSCLSLFKNGYKNLVDLCNPNSRLENFMFNTKILNEDYFNNKDIGNRNNIFDYSNNNYNIYSRLNNQNNNNMIISDLSNNANNIDEKNYNVFTYKVKSYLVNILFNISSCNIQLSKKTNLNLKTYLYNKYQNKGNESTLNIWPNLYLNGIKWINDFLKDIFSNLDLYKLLYNKTVILLNSINITLSNCFINEVNNECSINELIDIMFFILNDFLYLGPSYNEFIQLIIKNHPFISGFRDVLGNVSQTKRSLEGKIDDYIKKLKDGEDFKDNFDDFKKNVEEVYKTISNKFYLN